MSGHWRNLGIQLAVLAVMASCAALDMDLYIRLLSASLLIVPAAVWTVFGILRWASQQDATIDSLRESRDDALNWAISSTAMAVVGVLVLARSMGFLQVAIGPAATVLIGFAVVTPILPAIRFLRTWRSVWMPMQRERREHKD